MQTKELAITLTFLTAFLFWYIGYQSAKIANGVPIDFGAIDIPFVFVGFFWLRGLYDLKKKLRFESVAFGVVLFFEIKESNALFTLIA